MLIFIVLAFFVAVGIAGFQYIFKNKERSQLNYWLSFLRFLALFSIFILLINPSVKKRIIETIKPKLLVAIDNSSSIKHQSQSENVLNFVELLKNNTALNDKFEVDFYQFGTQLNTLDSLSFKESKTNLQLPFKEFSKLYKDETNPIVIITDGNQTLGNNVAFANYKSPVYPFIVGDTTIVEDIFINQLNVNQFTYINNNLPVEVFINYNGDKSVTKTFKVYHNNKVVYNKQIEFSTTKKVHTESFFITSKQSGNQYYTAVIEPLVNEKNKENNSKIFSVNVIEDQTKILLLTSITHPDLGMLKKAIESNKQRSVTILNIDNKNLKLIDYQLIIIYQPNNKFNAVFKEVVDKKLNHFIITGLSTDWNFLNSAQKIFSKTVTNQSEKYSPVLNKEYAIFQTNEIDFNSFAPLEDLFGEVNFSSTYNTLLYQKIGTITLQKPLLATYEVANQKGAILFGENSWQWRMNNFKENRSFEQFDGFIANLIQYLSSTQLNKRLNVVIEPMYYTNETISISASYLDKNLNFDDRSKLWITVFNNNKTILKKVPFALEFNSFNLELSDLKAGDYNYTVSVENQKETVSGIFKVLPFDVEQQFSNSNPQDLKILAQNTNGTIFYNNQENKLIQQLLLNDSYKIIQKSTIEKTPLIEWKWLLAFIVILLTIEWFMRKYYGKI